MKSFPIRYVKKSIFLYILIIIYWIFSYWKLQFCFSLWICYIYILNYSTPIKHTYLTLFSMIYWCKLLYSAFLRFLFFLFFIFLKPPALSPKDKNCTTAYCFFVLFILYKFHNFISLNKIVVQHSLDWNTKFNEICSNYFFLHNFPK